MSQESAIFSNTGNFGTSLFNATRTESGIYSINRLGGLPEGYNPNLFNPTGPQQLPLYGPKYNGPLYGPANPFDELTFFRGTSKGYPGNPTLQRVGVTPVSTDPAVATVFATHNATSYGNGVVHISTYKNLRGVNIITEGNATTASLARKEAEIALEILPKDFARRASVTITDSEARSILREMGIFVPSKIKKGQITETVESIPKLTPSQVDEFIRKAQEIAKRGLR